MATQPINAQIHEPLRPADDAYRLMVASVQDYAIFLLDPAGLIQTWNKGAERINGYKADEIIGRHFSLLYEPDDIQKGKPDLELREALKRGSVRDQGWRLRKDGSRFWADVTLTALHGEDGTTRGFCKVTRDMTEQKAAEDKMRLSDERLRLMIESVQDYAIYMLDPEGNIASWNVGAERNKGYKAAEILGKHFSVFYTDPDLKNKLPQRNLEIAVREGHCVDEGWRVRKDGTVYWASIVITPLRNKEGVLTGFVKVTRDMSERKQAEDKLEKEVQERTRELRQSNRELEQFAYVASHDLQEPLRTVATYIDLLNARCGEKLDSASREYMNFAIDAAERARELIRDLLEFSQTGAKINSIRPADFGSILKQVLANLRASLESNQAEIEAGPMPIVPADGARILQLFQNLISNALKYRSERPLKIKVSSEETPDSWVFSVEDNGIGIAPEHHKKIFGLFQRLHAKHKYPGTGIGLAICQKIVEGHGGMIWVESEAGKGSTFKFTLPKADGEK
ncbi:MAG TPA: PAS domain S-box protein [Verrucomicrobiae bacterium]|nr:PAS domain S-box protein [Verrucomicrobiae bacterium]